MSDHHYVRAEEDGTDSYSKTGQSKNAIDSSSYWKNEAEMRTHSNGEGNGIEINGNKGSTVPVFGGSKVDVGTGEVTIAAGTANVLPVALSSPKRANMSVREALPSAPPMDPRELDARVAQYTAHDTVVEPHPMEPSAPPVARTVDGDPEHGDVFSPSAPPAPAGFWTQNELQTLEAQKMPTLAYVPPPRGERGLKSRAPEGVIDLPVAATVAGGEGTAEIQDGKVVLTTAAGVPISLAPHSRAITTYDGWAGVKSGDPVLNTRAEILSFLQTNNSPPNIACQCHGYHYEERTRQVSDTDINGNERRRTETYYVKITDFDYKIDLTRFVFPFGYIQNYDTKNISVPDVVDDYLNDANKLKTLQMKKEIGFNFYTLRAMVEGQIRRLGWHGGLTITFPRSNYSVRIYDTNCLSKMFENTCVYVLCWITIIPAIVMHCYRDCGGHKRIRSRFEIRYHPVQVFEQIKPMLWCPGFSGWRAAREMYRDFYW